MHAHEPKENIASLVHILTFLATIQNGNWTTEKWYVELRNKPTSRIIWLLSRGQKFKLQGLTAIIPIYCLLCLMGIISDEKILN